MTSRATEKVMGGGGVVWSYFLLPGGVQHMSASRVSLSFHHMFCLLFLCLLFGCWCLFPVLQVSWDFIIPPRVLDLDDRQGFTARSATQ